MPILRKLLSTTIYGSAATIGTFTIWTINCRFVPLSPADPIFTSKPYLYQNPLKNPTTQDLCERRVPLSKIRPALLEKAQDGALVENFCAGVWGGVGFEVQRKILERWYRGDVGRTGHQLWDKAELKESKYEVGTQITDHFEVVQKDENKITVRCGDSPLVTGVRESDGLFE